MEVHFKNIIDKSSADAAKRHALWNGELFSRICRGPVWSLWTRIHDQSASEKVLSAYLTLIEDAMDAGQLVCSARGENGSGNSQWKSFLELCLIELIPKELAGIAPHERLKLLAKLWNLGEGLNHEPPWMERNVLTQIDNLTDLRDVENFLIRVLESTLAPAVVSNWREPYSVCLLDPRAVEDEFLPGELSLVAPAVVCVQDRRRSDVRLGIFLRRSGKSHLTPLGGGLPVYVGESGPRATLQQNSLNIAGHTVALPFLGICHRHMVTRSGFVIATATDSQRIWVVDSA